MAICGVLALAAGACTGGGGNARATQSHRQHVTRGSAGTGRPQAASLMLAEGRSSARYRITAPSPARYGFEVTVIAPAAANVSVNARTWYGANSAFSSPRAIFENRAGARAPRTSALSDFRCCLPSAGTWTIVASKHSEPAATVRIAITFAKP
jgi:hypothetical protein